MTSHPRASGPRGDRRGRQLRPSLQPFEQRVVPSLAFPGIAGITFDASGDVFVSYDSTTRTSGQQQAVAEVDSDGFLASASVFGTTGASAFPGALTEVGSSDSLPSTTSGDILELQPNGQLFVFNPVSGTSSQYDDLANDTANASNVFDVQTRASVDLSGQISLAGASYGDFGIYQNSLVVSAESNNWDFVVRLTYGSSGGVATVLVASPVSDGLSATPEGVAVDSQGTVLTTMPYVPAGSSTAIDVPVGFNLFYDTGSSPSPVVPSLGLTSVPDIDSAGITVDSQNNFILAATTSSLYGGGPGVVHINSALTAFLADPLTASEGTPTGITYQEVGGTNYLALTDADSDTYTVAGELSLFSGQVSPAQLRNAYGISQIRFTGPGGTTVTGDGSGQTIAIVEEGVDPTLGADLATFDQYFGIPAPPSFTVVDQDGVTTQNDAIVGEASLDVEWAHAVAPGASIIVYNAAYVPTNAAASFEYLMEAMQQASKLPGVSVVTLSYGEPESSLAASGLDEQSFDSDFTTPGVTFLAAAGDSGIYEDGSYQIAANYPAASPNIVSVGGTSIVIDAAGDYPGTGPSGEVAWGDGTQSGASGGGGGGLSAVESEPAWQSSVVPTSMDPDGARALPDLSMDSGAAQEYDVFTSTLSGSSVSASAVGWLGDAGTSAASPIWAGLIAIADQGRVLAGGTPLTGNTQTLPALYSLPAADFHDIVYGNNGDPAGPGYDLASGRGTPVANLLVPDLAGYEIASQMAITTEPPSSVGAGSPFGLTVRAEDRLGNAVNGGTVTVALGNNPGDAILGGTLKATVVNGVATFSGLTLSQPGTGYTLTVTDSTIAGAQTTTSMTVTGGGNATKVVVTALPLAPVFGQTVTFDATVSVDSPGTGVPAGTVTFEEGSSTLGTVSLTDGVADFPMTPSAAGPETITITYNGDVNDRPNSVAVPLMVGQAMPTLTWAEPGNITAGTPLGAAQLDAMASFDGVPLPGVLTYTPSAGTVLPVGNDQTLKVSFQPTDAADFQSVAFSVPLNVLPQSTSTPTSTPVMVIGEQPVFQRKLKKNGKPAGKAVLVGFTLDFNTSLSAAAVSNPANYDLGTVTIEKVHRHLDRVVRPIKNFRVTYAPASDSVTLELAGTPSFRAGGRLTVLPGVTSASGDDLIGTTEFTITPGGKTIEPS
jgi:Bacterial Ig-like domain (group 3)